MAESRHDFAILGDPLPVQQITAFGSETLGLLGRTWSLAIARLPAVAFLIVVHRTVLAALFAAGWLVRRKRDRAHRGNHNREQDFSVILHRLSVVRAARRVKIRRHNYPEPSSRAQESLLSQQKKANDC